MEEFFSVPACESEIELELKKPAKWETVVLKRTL